MANSGGFVLLKGPWLARMGLGKKSLEEYAERVPDWRFSSRMDCKLVEELFGWLWSRR